MDPVNKERILKVSIWLFARYGITQVSLKDITKSTSCSIVEIKTEFGDKPGLLMEGIRHEINNIKKTIDKIDECNISPVEKFIHTCTIVFRYSVSRCPMFYHDLPNYLEAERSISIFRDYVRERCKEYLITGFEEGHFLPQFNHESLIYILVEELGNTPFRYQQYVLISFLQGILSEKGMNELKSANCFPLD